MTRICSALITLLLAVPLNLTALAAEQPAAPAPVIQVPPASAVDNAPPATPAITIQPAAPTPAAAPLPTPAKLVIGYVDLLKLGSESIPGKAAEARFKAKADKYKKQISDREKQLEKQKKAIEEKLPTMTPDERAAKAKEFDKKLDEYRKFVQKAQKEMEPLQQELSLSIYSMMEKAAQEYGRRKGLLAVVPKKELLFVGDGIDSLDVTDDLLQLVNEQNPTKK